MRGPQPLHGGKAVKALRRSLRSMQEICGCVNAEKHAAALESLIRRCVMEAAAQQGGWMNLKALVKALQPQVMALLGATDAARHAVAGSLAQSIRLLVDITPGAALKKGRARNNPGSRRTGACKTSNDASESCSAAHAAVAKYPHTTHTSSPEYL